MERSPNGGKRSAKPYRIKSQKYKGFTLIEMSLALSLMGILLLMGTEVWSIMGSIHSLYSEHQSQSYESLKLRASLEGDLYHYPRWQKEKRFIFYVRPEGDTLIKYEFADAWVCRKQKSFTDTFRFSLYVQPFEPDAVLTLIDSQAKLWYRHEMWSLAHAKP